MDSSDSDLESLGAEYEPEFESDCEDESDVTSPCEGEDDDNADDEDGDKEHELYISGEEEESGTPESASQRAHFSTETPTVTSSREYFNVEYKERGNYSESYLSESSFEDEDDGDSAVTSDSEDSSCSPQSRSARSSLHSSKSFLTISSGFASIGSKSSSKEDVTCSEPSSVSDPQMTEAAYDSSADIHHVSVAPSRAHGAPTSQLQGQFTTFRGVSDSTPPISDTSVLGNKNTDSGVDQRLSKRQRIIKELLDTEHTYQNHLRLVIKYFQEPLQENGIIEPHIGVTLFSNLKALLSVNEELLEHLETDGVAGAFEHMAPFLKLYSTYANNHERALAALMDLDQKNIDFAMWRRAQEEIPEIGGLKLNALLITPVQRIPRYKLLLDELLQTTSEGDEEYAHIKECVRQVGQVAQHINEHIKQQDNFMRMAAIQRMLSGSAAPNIVMPGRIFLKEGMLSKVSKKAGWSQERMFFLFSDMLMYAKARLLDGSNHQGAYTCCCMMPLHHCKVSRLFGRSHGDGALFTIECKEESLLLYSDPATVEGWITALTKAINAVQTSRRTLKKPSSAKRPLRRPALIKMKKLQESDPLHNWGKSPTSKENSPRNLKRALKQSRMNCLSPKESFKAQDPSVSEEELLSPKKKCIKDDKENPRFTSVKSYQKLEAKHLWCLSPRKKLSKESSPTPSNPCKQIIRLFSSDKKKTKDNKKTSTTSSPLVDDQQSLWDTDGEDLESPVPITDKPSTLSRMPKHLRDSQKKINRKKRKSLLTRYTFDDGDDDSKFKKVQNDWQPSVFGQTPEQSADEKEDRSDSISEQAENHPSLNSADTDGYQSDVWWYQPDQLERQYSGYLNNANTTLSDDSFENYSSDDAAGDPSNSETLNEENDNWTPECYTWDQTTVWRNPYEDDSSQGFIDSSNNSWMLSPSTPVEMENFTSDDRFATMPTCRTYKYNFIDEHSTSSHSYRPLSTIPEDIMESPSSPSPQRPKAASRSGTPVKKMRQGLMLAGQATQDLLNSPTTGQIAGQACILQ